MKTKSEAKTNYALINIVSEYSDEHHLLNEEKVREYLILEHGLYVDMDVIHESLKQLIDAGVNIQNKDDSVFYKRDVFNYTNTKAHCIHIQGLSIEHSVKKHLLDKLLNNLSKYQRKKLKRELQYEASGNP